MKTYMTWKKLAIGHINGKCNLTQNPTNKKVKLSSLETETVFPIRLINSIRTILLNILIRNI